MMFVKTNRSNSGFTLIELLVVIAIIGLLASIVLVALNGARSKSRDAKRLADMRQIQNALEMYYNENGSYPTCSGNDLCTSTTPLGSYGDINSLGVVPAYVSSVPYDPTNINAQYGYYYARGYRRSGTTIIGTGLATDYIMGMRLENSSNPAARTTYAAWNNSFLNYLTGN